MGGDAIIQLIVDKFYEYAEYVSKSIPITIAIVLLIAGQITIRSSWTNNSGDY